MSFSNFISHPNDSAGKAVLRLVRWLVLANAVILLMAVGMDLLLGDDFGPGAWRSMAAITLGSVIGFGIQRLRQMPDGKNESGLLEPME